MGKSWIIMIKRKNYDILPEPYEEDYIVWFW